MGERTDNWNDEGSDQHRLRERSRGGTSGREWIGRRIVTWDRTSMEIVGVAANAKYISLR